jgi:predicted O-methyltransferase YrrM
MEIFVDRVQEYLNQAAHWGPGIPPVLEHMEAEGRERKFPIVGPEVGRFFAQLAAVRRARRILELGSGYGYSALWWTVGNREVEVDCTEYDEENIKRGMAYAREAGVADRIHFHKGDALESARRLEGPWDLVFCDIDKGQYPAALEFAAECLRPGDLLLFDNMLWHGRVGEAESEWEASTRAVVETTRRIYEDERFLASLLPIRDGVLMALRR